MIRPKSPLATLVLCSLAAGCAARSPEVEGAATRDERRQQIALLDQRIAAAEVELGLRAAPVPTGDAADGEVAGGDAAAGAAEPVAPPPTMAEPPPGVAQAPMSPPPATPTRREPGADGARCARVCRSVLAICDASRRICRLAEDLDDEWAQGRCEASARSCDAAEGRAASSCGDC